MLIQQVRIPVSHGELEGMLQTGEPEAELAAIVCHPHPLHGGTMHNKVVFHAAKAFGELGWPVLRFNFRGVGASTGTYGEGIGEQEDARAALDFLGRENVVMAGFSFGSVVALSVGAQDARAPALCGIGVPADRPLEPVARSTKPKLFVHGRLDELCPPEAMAHWFETVAEPKRLEWIEGADHFLTNRAEPLKAAIISYFGELRAP
ncbi:MAG TPA: alpha/beta family hydrolase [Chloroflexota bacterium]